MYFYMQIYERLKRGTEGKPVMIMLTKFNSKTIPW